MGDVSGGCKCDMLYTWVPSADYLKDVTTGKDLNIMRLSYWGLSLTILLTLPASIVVTYFDYLLRMFAPPAFAAPDGITGILRALSGGVVPIAVWVTGATALSLAEGMVASERSRLFLQLLFTYFWLCLCLLFVNRIIVYGV